MHQPLHTGFTTDRGGNSIQVTYFGAAVNLHATWDNNMIYDQLTKNYSDSRSDWVQDLIGRLLPNGEWYIDAQGWMKCNEGSLECSSIWATEGIEYACANSYECIATTDAPCSTEKVKQGSALAARYYDQAIPIINLRIAQGWLYNMGIVGLYWMVYYV